MVLLNILHVMNLFNVKISSSLPIRLPNETTIPVHSIGQIRLPNMILNNVLHIPSFKCNLLSISRLTKALQCFVTFFSIFLSLTGPQVEETDWNG